MRSTLIDITGQRFGRLTVESRAPNRGKAVYWWAICECGTRKGVGAGKKTFEVTSVVYGGRFGVAEGNET